MSNKISNVSKKWLDKEIEKYKKLLDEETNKKRKSKEKIFYYANLYFELLEIKNGN